MMRSVAKRAFDVTSSGVALILLAPLMLVVALAIKCSSPGPVFFRQQRVGRWEVPFWVHKFRTMRMGSEGPVITTAGDTRVTPLGRWLRYTKIDELPQFINVLRGEMSIVGPRPQMAKYVLLYNAEQRRVLSVRPGLTGPYQIVFTHYEHVLAAQADPEDYYITTHLPEKLSLELEYVRHHSLLGDLRFIVHTFFVIWRPTIGLRRWKRAQRMYENTTEKCDTARQRAA